MNAAATVKGAAAHGGPIVLSAGVAMLAAALTYPGSAPAPGAIGPSPAPTVTVTQTAPPAPVAVPSQSPSAAAAPSLVPAGSVSGRTGRDVPVAAQSGPSPRPQTPVPGGSSPAPGTGPTSSARGCAPVSVCMRLGIAPRTTITIKGR